MTSHLLWNTHTTSVMCRENTEKVCQVFFFSLQAETNILTTERSNLVTVKVCSTNG